MSKHGSNDKSATSGKNQRKSVTLEEKLDVIKRYECNRCTAGIANAMGIPESTLRTIRKEAEKIKESCKSATRMTASKITQMWVLIMKKLEKVLAQWFEHEQQYAVAVSSLSI
jgi:hypothetical protein